MAVDPGVQTARTSTNYVGVTPQNAWQIQLLKDLQALGYPVQINNTNIAILTYWTLSEDNTGNFNGGNNPLAISGLYPGVVGCIAQCGTNSPIGKYDTLSNGVNATAHFLAHESYNGVLTALMDSQDNADGTPNNKGMAAGFIAINASGWCKGCQGGHYPIALYQALGKTGQQIASDLQKVTPGFTKGGVDIPTVGDVAGAVGGAVSGAVGWTEALGKFFSTLTSVKFWKRVGLGALGVFILLLGLTAIFSETKTGQQVGQRAGEAATVAALA